MIRFITKICLCFVILVLQSCSEIIVPDSDSNLNVDDFESAWNHINLIYPLFDFKKIDWDAIHTEYRVRAEQSVGDEIYAVLIDLVGELKDAHAKVITLGGLSIRPYNSPRTLRDKDVFKPNVIRKYFNKPLRVVGNESIEYEFVADNVGYVRIATFGNALQGNVNDIDIVLDYFSSAGGLIVDVRNNGGGSSVVYDQIIGRLINEPLETESSFQVWGTRPPYTISPQGPLILQVSGNGFNSLG